MSDVDEAKCLEGGNMREGGVEIGAKGGEALDGELEEC